MTSPSTRDAQADRGDKAQSQAFLATHRGQAAFAREYAKLIASIVAEATRLGKTNPQLVPVIRQSPERVIVQLGPFAMTVGWLRKGGEGASIGELLVIYWNGTIAQSAGVPTEYNARRTTPVAPEILWEETLVAFALKETEWCWRSAAHPSDGISSLTLAERSVQWLAALKDDARDLPAASLSLATDAL